MDIAGLDLALGATGYADPAGRLWTFKPPSYLTGYQRHWHQAEAVVVAVRRDRVELVVLEDYAPGGFGINSLIRSAELGGIVRAGLTRANVRFELLRPNTVKLWATGNGRADKAAMLETAEAAGVAPLNDNEADAFWLRAIGRWHCGYSDGPEPFAEPAPDPVLAIDWPVAS